MNREVNHAGSHLPHGGKCSRERPLEERHQPLQSLVIFENKLLIFSGNNGSDSITENRFERQCNEVVFGFPFNSRPLQRSGFGTIGATSTHVDEGAFFFRTDGFCKLQRGLVGVSKININGYMVDDLPKNDPILADLQFFEQNFDGVLPLEIKIDTKRKNGLANISMLKKIEKLENMISAYPAISKSLSVNEVLKFSKQAYYNGDPNFYSSPTQSEALFILKYAKNAGKASGSNSLMRTYVDSLNQSTRISFQMADIGSKKSNELLSEIKPRIDSIFNPENLDIRSTSSFSSLNVNLPIKSSRLLPLCFHF